MTTRRTLFVAAPAFATLAAAHAQNAPDSSKVADFLFVQTAKGMTFNKAGDKLALNDVSPVTLFFTDRPERIAGNMKTTAFLEQGQGQLPVGSAQCGCIHPGRGTASAGCRGATGPCPARRQPDLHCQGPAGRDADQGRRRLCVHRHHWDAAYTVVIRRCRTTFLPTGLLVSIDERLKRAGS